MNIKGFDFLAGEYLTEYMGPDPPENKGTFEKLFCLTQFVSIQMNQCKQ